VTTTTTTTMPKKTTLASFGIRLLGWLYGMLVVSSVCGLFVAALRYRSDVGRYQAELDDALLFVKAQCIDGNEVTKWQRGAVCADKKAIVAGPSPSDRARIDFLRSMMLCTDLGDCRARYAWLFESVYVLLSKALLVLLVLGVAGVLALIWGNRTVTMYRQKDMELPTVDDDQRRRNYFTGAGAACRQTCPDVCSREGPGAGGGSGFKMD
jgi:hypothetical protein